MPGSPKRIRPDCPYSASQLDLIKLQDDRVALDLGILSEDEIGMPESPKRTCVDCSIHRSVLQSKEVRGLPLSEADMPVTYPHPLLQMMVASASNGFREKVQLEL